MWTKRRARAWKLGDQKVHGAVASKSKKNEGTHALC